MRLLLHGRASGKSEAVIGLPIEVETSPRFEAVKAANAESTRKVAESDTK